MGGNSGPIVKGPLIKRYPKVAFGDGGGSLTNGLAGGGERARGIVRAAMSDMYQRPETVGYSILQTAAKLALDRPLERAV